MSALPVNSTNFWKRRPRASIGEGITGGDDAAMEPISDLNNFIFNIVIFGFNKGVPVATLTI